MFFFPYACNFPVRHWPFTTVGLIALNVAIYFWMGHLPQAPAAGQLTAEQEQRIAQAEQWRLSYGDGLKPEQWVLSSFLHTRSGPLFVNMVFLWVFGLIVEGRLGWMRFLPCYLVLAIGGAAIEQAAMLASSGGQGNFGAACAIYGLMAIAIVWAPKREVTFFYWVVFFFGTVDLPVLMTAGLALLIDVAWFLFAGVRFDEWTGWPHVLGFAVGLPIGVVAIKQRFVEADGADLFSRFGVKDVDLSGPGKEERAAAEFDEHADERDAKILADGREAFEGFLERGNADAALRLYGKLLAVGEGLTLRRRDLVRLIQSLHDSKKYSESAPFMLELAARFPDQATPARLKLAKLCVTKLQRPSRALELINQISPDGLPQESVDLLTKIDARATAMQQQGVVELDDGDW
ncbi:MAG: rhomboid family intramembrane serine protease [Planctomycetota bacterium]